MYVDMNRSDRKRTLKASLATIAFAVVTMVIALLASSSMGAHASSLTTSKGETPAHSSKEPQNSNPDDFRTLLAEGFEGNNLSITSFHSYVPTCMATGCGWSVLGNFWHSGIHSVWAPDVPAVSDQQLVLNGNSPISIPADATDATLSFWHAYSFEKSVANYYDGGVLEVSANGGPWSDSNISFITGGYNSTLFQGSNPLAGRSAWGGETASGFYQVKVSLMAYAGQSILIRFREGTDNSNASFGWWIDDIQLSISSPSPCTEPTWGTRNSYPISASGLASVAFNGRIYSFGGRDSTQSVVASAYSLNPQGYNWSPLAPLPEPRAFASAVSDDQYIYILGGYDSDFHATTNLWRYNPDTNTYTTLTSYSHPTVSQSAVVRNGRIYRIGGYDGSSSVNTVEVYTINAGTWASTTNYPIAVRSVNSISYGQYIYTAGGTNQYGQTKTYRFDPATSTWDDAAIDDLPGTSYDRMGALLDGKWVLVGGGGTNIKVISWDPATNLWSALPDMGTGVYGAGSAVLGQSLFILGGTNNSGNSISTTQYYLGTSCTPDPTICTLSYTDVDPANTFYPYIHCLACYGIISGYSDGTFRPGNAVTRGQIAKIVSNAAGFTEIHNNQLFNDINTNNTFYIYIARLATRNIISGYACGGPGEPCDVNYSPYFRPAGNASRGQLAKIVCKAFNCGVPANQIFADVPPGHTFYNEIGQLYEIGSINGYNCGGPGEPCIAPGNLPYFRPGANVSRGQTAKIVSYTWFPGCSTP